MEKKCLRCGGPVTGGSLRRYCTDTCRQYAYLERHGLNIKRTEELASETRIVTLSEETKVEEPASVNDAVSVNNEKLVNDNTEEITLPGNEEQKTENPSVNDAQKQEEEKPVIDVRAQEQITKLADELGALRQQVKKMSAVQKPIPEKRIMNRFCKLHYPFWRGHDFDNVRWVNERLRSHLNALIKLANEEEIEVGYIKNIYDKLISIQESTEYRNLPGNYPYREFTNDIALQLKQIVNQYEDETTIIEFGINDKTKTNMRIITYEIGNTVLEIDHSSPPRKKSNKYQRRETLRKLGINRQ